MKSVKSTWLYGAARANKQEIKRFVKFTIVGFSGLIVDFSLLNILELILHVDSWLAWAVAFVVAATNNFIWNRLWVYPETRQHSVWKHFPTFLAVNTVGLGINELISFLFQHRIEALVGSPALGLNITKAIAAAIVMMWNFIVNRLVTFRDVKWQSGAEPALPNEEEEPVASAL